jgi:hypothetical protein
MNVKRGLIWYAILTFVWEKKQKPVRRTILQTEMWSLEFSNTKVGCFPIERDAEQNYSECLMWKDSGAVLVCFKAPYQHLPLEKNIFHAEEWTTIVMTSKALHLKHCDHHRTKCTVWPVVCNIFHKRISCINKKIKFNLRSFLKMENARVLRSVYCACV